MLSKEVLESFCEKEGCGVNRKSLLRPFNLDSFTYATDGIILVRVDLVPEYEKYIDANVEIVRRFTRLIDNAENEYTPLMPTAYDLVQCTECKGTGKIETCSDCDGSGEVSWSSDGGFDYEDTCQMCDGKGVVMGSETSQPCRTCGWSGFMPKIKVVKHGSKWISPVAANKLLVLPNIQIEVCKINNLDPIPFIFDGGKGILMPCRNPQDC